MTTLQDNEVKTLIFMGRNTLMIDFNTYVLLHT